MNLPAIEESEPGHHYRPRYNPTFLARVWAKRKAAEALLAKKSPIVREAERIAREKIETATVYSERLLAEARLCVIEAQATAVRIIAEAEAKATTLSHNCARHYAARQIASDVAKEFGLTFAILAGSSRSKSVVVARFAAITAVHIQRPDMSLPMIGRVFNRDHTTILAALVKSGKYNNARGLPAEARKRLVNHRYKKSSDAALTEKPEGE